MKLKNLFPILVEKCLFSCNKSARLFLSVVMIILLAPTTEARAQQTYAITTDGNREVYDADIWSQNEPLSKAAAGTELEIRLKGGVQPASGKYFTGEYTVNGVSLGANEWGSFNSGFTMPAKAVTVAALQATKTELTFDFTTAGTIEMPTAALQLFNGDERLEGKRTWSETDNCELIDFDGSGTPDMKWYFDAADEHCYVERLATADAAGSFSFSYTEPTDCYSSITFIFRTPLMTLDVSVTFTETTYDGQAHALNVSIPEGATITYADTQDGTYSATAPTFKDVVNTTIYYKVTKQNYEDASGSVAVKINKKPITVTAENLSMAFGDTEPVLTYTIEGLVEGETVDIKLQRSEGNDAGTYDITLKSISGNDNYSVTFVKGTFTITPKPVTVKSGLTVSSATINSIIVYYVDTSHAIITGAVDNDKLSITNVVARLQNGSTEVCNLEYTNATILLEGGQANNYVVAEQGNQPSAPITVSTETVTEADGSQIIYTSKTPDLDVSEVYSIAADGKGTVIGGHVISGGAIGHVYGRFSPEGVIINTVSIVGSSQLLISGDDAPNILVNTTTKKDVEGNEIATSASLTIKQNRSADASGDVNTNKSTKIAVGNILGKYRFHVNNSGHGTLSVSPASANMGDWVTITVNPDNGYKLEKLYVTDGGSHSTEDTAIRPTRSPSPSDPNQYTFQIPFTEGWTASSTGLNINASFVADGTGGGGDGDNPESQDTPTSGKFGEFTWNVSESHGSSVFDVLTISGFGKMETGNESPWSAYNTQIKTVIINEGVTCIGNNVFAGYTGDHVYIIVPKDKILSVRSDLNKSPELIRPTSGQVDIIEHLFANPSDRTSSLALMVDDVYPQLKEGDTFTLASEGTESPLTVSIPYICYHSNSKSGEILFSEAEIKDQVKKIGMYQENGIGMMVDATVTAELVDGTNDTYKVTENKATKLTLLGIPSNIAKGDTYFYRPQNISFEGADIDIQNINFAGCPLSKGDNICLIRDFGKTVGNITGSKSPNYRYIYHAYLKASESFDLIFEIDSKIEEQKPSTQDLNDQAATTMIVQYDTKKVTGDDNTGTIFGGRYKVTAIKKTVKEKWGEVHNIIGGGTRAAFAEQEADDEIEIVSGQEYKILRDGFIVLNFYTPDASITVNSIIIRRPGDANNDGYLNAADLVEMVNAKNDKASERFNLTNADIDRDGIITQNDIDIVVKLIMEQTDEE